MFSLSLRSSIGNIIIFLIYFEIFFICLISSPLRSESYDGASNFNALLTPLTFLVSYFNSAINPFLYAFLSRNFRKGMRELLLCSFKKAKSQPVKQRIPLNVSKFENLFFILYFLFLVFCLFLWLPTTSTP